MTITLKMSVGPGWFKLLCCSGIDLASNRTHGRCCRPLPPQCIALEDIRAWCGVVLLAELGCCACAVAFTVFHNILQSCSSCISIFADSCVLALPGLALALVTTARGDGVGLSLLSLLTPRDGRLPRGVVMLLPRIFKNHPTESSAPAAELASGGLWHGSVLLCDLYDSRSQGLCSISFDNQD